MMMLMVAVVVVVVMMMMIVAVMMTVMTALTRFHLALLQTEMKRQWYGGRMEGRREVVWVGFERK